MAIHYPLSTIHHLRKAVMFAFALLFGVALLAAIAIVLGITGGTGAESYNVQDAQVALSLALPAAASSTVTSTGIDTGETTKNAVQLGSYEFLLTAPAVTTTMLPNTDTFTYNILCADDAALSVNVTTLVAAAIVQTGAGSAGAASAAYRYRLPSVSQRYVGFNVVSSAGTATAAAVSATMNAVF
jgi:hypothetical protein